MKAKAPLGRESGCQLVRVAGRFEVTLKVASEFWTLKELYKPQPIFGVMRTAKRSGFRCYVFTVALTGN
jgi:hypothetical protein